MPECVRCNKWGLFLKLNARGHCAACAAIVEEQERRIQIELERKKKIQTSQPVSDFSLSKIPTRAFVPPTFVEDATAVYVYYAVPLSHTNYNALCDMVKRNKYTLELKFENGDALVYWNGQQIGVVQHNTISRMIGTWITDGLPMVAHIMRVVPGQETFGIAFYRNEAERNKNRDKVVVKLAGFSSSEKQMNIACCTSGEKLVCEEDEDNEGRVNVMTIVSKYHIGNLPAKYAKEFLEGDGISLALFDHSETNENGTEVPYIAIYN